MIHFNGNHVLFMGKYIGKLCNKVDEIQSAFWMDFSLGTLAFLIGGSLLFAMAFAGIYSMFNKKKLRKQENDALENEK